MALLLNMQGGLSLAHASTTAVRASQSPRPLSVDSPPADTLMQARRDPPEWPNRAFSVELSIYNAIDHEHMRAPRTILYPVQRQQASKIISSLSLISS